MQGKETKEDYINLRRHPIDTAVSISLHDAQDLD